MKPHNFIDYSGISKGFINVIRYIGNQKWECQCTKCLNIFNKDSRLVRKLHDYSCCRKCSFRKENYSPLKLQSSKKRGRQAGHNKKYKGTKSISGHQLSHIKCHAKARNLYFSDEINCEYLESLLILQEFKCAISKLPITHSPYNNDYYRKNGISIEYNTASLDRIDSSKGYEIGNLHWVHKDIQKMKWDIPLDKFISLCRIVTKEQH